MHMEAMEAHSLVAAVSMGLMEVILWDGLALGCLVRAVFLGGEIMLTKLDACLQLRPVKPAARLLPKPEDQMNQGLTNLWPTLMHLLRGPNLYVETIEIGHVHFTLPSKLDNLCSQEPTKLACLCFYFVFFWFICCPN